ncbi:MAG TPA: NADH-quinone oxidoreductase subunit L [Terriglobia bacterium]|nr:NADH-quinone oxidoreductase subunit L [Terriglobia bacterium]
MLALLWLIPILPFAGFIVLGLLGRRMTSAMVAIIGVGSIGLSVLFSALVTAAFLLHPPDGQVFTQTLWTWIQVGSFAPGISFYLDALSLVMVLVVGFVSFFIHLYSMGYMRGEEGYSRFFAYMNLFVGSMLTLVLADNLVLLYLGWEGVGLCSYLLIGFWYQDPANGRAARKAFIVTRIGDASFAVGLFLLFSRLGTLHIQELMRRAAQQWPVGSGVAVAASALLLGGAVGKSAQLPLQTWLPDAMAGPTPVSALIHAATMVTAGVYLIARTHVLFSLAPAVQFAVSIIGVATLLLAGFSGLVQRDIKRVLAYSTISQIGYMFLALGVGAWSAAIFHLLSHAFFKALLFLAAGVIIHALHNEHDLFRMGGLRKELPLTFWVFLIGALGLSGLPPADGFSSKGLILSETWFSPLGGRGLWAAGLAGVFLTSLYTFRMLFLAFFGPRQQPVVKRPGLAEKLPLIVLALLTILAAGLNWPSSWGGVALLTSFLNKVLPSLPMAHVPAPRGAAWLEVVAVDVSVLGIAVAWLLTVGAPALLRRGLGSPVVCAVRRFWLAGWGFDWLYDRFFVWPLVWLSRINQGDFIDLFYRGLEGLAGLMYRILSWTQTGRIRWYAASVALGALIILALVIFL